MTTAVNVFQFFRHMNQFVPLVPLLSYLLVLFTCLFIEGKEVCETDTLLLIPALWDINKSFKKITFVTASIYLLYKKNTDEFHPSSKSMEGVEPFSAFTKRVNYGHVRKLRLSSL